MKQKSNNCFYTYAYLDPRKNGQFTYGDYIFESKPFYIGKGKDTRLLEHLKEARCNHIKCNQSKTKIIQELLNLKINPLIVKIIKNVTNEEACKNEIELISLIGREDLSIGPLTNMTNGGEGFSSGNDNPAKNPSVRNEISKKLKGKNNPSKRIDVREKMSIAAKNRWKNKKKRKELIQSQKDGWTDKAREDNSKRMKELWKDPEYKNKIITSRKGCMNNEQTKQKLRFAAKKRMEDKNIRNKLSLAAKGNDSHAKLWIITFPNNEIQHVKNLANFCKQNNLNSESMYRVAKGQQTHHKNFIVLQTN